MFDMNRLSYRKPLAESALTLRDSFKTNDHMSHSYFAEACSFLSTLDNWTVVMERSMYQGICESNGSTVLINESVSEWFETFKSLLKKVVDFLHALLNKFLVGLNMFLSREAFIKNHKKDFTKFNENHKFTMSIFTFTLDNDIPKTAPIYNSADWKNVFKIGKESGTTYDLLDNDTHSASYDAASDGNPRTLKAKNSGGALGDNEFSAAYTELKDAMDNGDIYDKVRAEMLGMAKGTRIDASDYSKELYEVFRDGQSGKEDHEFEYSDIQDALIRFDQYDRCKKALTKQKKDAEREYKEVIKKLDHYVKLGKDGLVTTSADGAVETVKLGTSLQASKYSLIVKALSTVVHEVSNIHTLAFTAKLDAYKDCFKQDKTILYKALYRIMGNIRSGERKFSTPKESD